MLTFWSQALNTTYINISDCIAIKVCYHVRKVGKTFVFYYHDFCYLYHDLSAILAYDALWRNLAVALWLCCVIMPCYPCELLWIVWVVMCLYLLFCVVMVWWCKLSVCILSPVVSALPDWHLAACFQPFHLRPYSFTQQPCGTWCHVIWSIPYAGVAGGSTGLSYLGRS
jgi:hypothetical protein